MAMNEEASSKNVSNIKEGSTTSVTKGEISNIPNTTGYSTSDVVMTETTSPSLSNKKTTLAVSRGEDTTNSKVLTLALTAEHSDSGNLSGSSSTQSGPQKSVFAKRSFEVCRQVDDYPSWHPVRKRLNLELYDNLEGINQQKFKEHSFCLAESSDQTATRIFSNLSKKLDIKLSTQFIDFFSCCQKMDSKVPFLPIHSGYWEDILTLPLVYF